MQRIALAQRLRRNAGAKTRGRRRRYDVAFYVPRMAPLLSVEARSPSGGAETQVLLLGQELARRDMRVRLVVFRLPSAAIPHAVGGVSVLVRPPYRAHDRFGKVREALAISLAVARVGADVVVCRAATYEVGIAGMAAKLTGRKFVYSSANVSDFRDDRPARASRLLSRLRRPSSTPDAAGFDFSRFRQRWVDLALYRLGFFLADEIVVQTEEQAGLCLRQFGREATVIKSIAEPAPLRVSSPEAFLWIGRLVDYKRPLSYVELARAVPDARFWMIAPLESEPDVELVRAVMSAVSETPNLDLLEPRPRREVMVLIDRAVAVVNTADFEGMPNIFLEGWARGVPALASTHDPDGVIERFGLGGFADDSRERLVELARQLWADRGNQRPLAERCRAYIERHHSPDAIGARWEELLHRTAVGKPAEMAGS